MKDHICIRKQIKFERIQQQFGCGYYAVCCQTQCPCPLKNKETYDARIYAKMLQEFRKEGEELLGA